MKMKDQTYLYRCLQRYVELGYDVADNFMIKSKWFKEVIDGKPQFLPGESYSVYSDLKINNMGILDTNNDLLFNKELRIIDLDGFFKVEYNDLESYELCTLNFYGDILNDNEKWMYAFAYNFGEQLRLGMLGELIFANILATSKIGLFTECNLKERIHIADSNIICLRIVQNYIKKYFDELGMNFEKYYINIKKTYDEIAVLDIPAFLQDAMLKYLAQYTLIISFCKSDISNAFSSMEILHYLSVKKQDYLMAAWTLGNQLNALVSREIYDNLSKRKETLEKILGCELKYNGDLLGTLWETMEINMSSNSSSYYKIFRNETDRMEKLNIELLKATLWICKKDVKALEELKDLLKDSQINTQDLIVFNNCVKELLPI